MLVVIFTCVLIIHDFKIYRFCVREGISVDLHHIKSVLEEENRKRNTVQSNYVIRFYVADSEKTQREQKGQYDVEKTEIHREYNRVNYKRISDIDFKSLTVAQEKYLLYYIALPCGGCDRNKKACYAMKNAIMDKMTRISTNLMSISVELLNIIKDEAQDDVIRSYCIQYLPRCYRNVESEMKIDIERELHECCKNRHVPSSGTALLMLSEIQQYHSTIMSNEIALNNLIASFLNDSNTDIEAGIAALHLAKRQNLYLRNGELEKMLFVEKHHANIIVERIITGHGESELMSH